MCLLRSRAWQKALGCCCVSIWGKLLAFRGRSAGERRREGRTEEWRVSSSVVIQWGDSGISCSCFTTHTHTCTHAQNSLLAPHHSNYGTIKARWHLIFCHFLRLNMTNSGITFPLTWGGLWWVSRSSLTLNLSASQLPIVALPQTRPRLPSRRLCLTLCLPLPSHIVFPSSLRLFTYLHWSPPPSRWFLSISASLGFLYPPDSHTHASFNPALEQSGQLFPTSVVRTTQPQDSSRTPRSGPSQAASEQTRRQ